jgi:hypothetical protein
VEERVRLSPAFAAGGTAHADELVLSEDGSTVAFLAKSTSAGPWELWAARTDGETGSAERIGPLASSARAIQSFALSSDGARAVYLADADVDEKAELWMAPTDASSAPIRLNSGLIAAGDVQEFSLPAAGNVVLYRADWAQDERFEAFTVPVQGPSAAAELLNRPLVGAETVDGVGEVAPGAVVYFVTESGVPREMRGVPAAGPASAEYPITGLPITGFASIAFDAESFVFVADYDVELELRLFRAPLDGSSGPVEIDDPLWPSPVEWLVQAAIAPGRGELFFIAGVGEAPRHLWSTRLDGSQTSPTRLTPDPVASGDVDNHRIEASPDGYAVLFHGDLDEASKRELYIADALVFAADFDEEGDTSEWEP